MKCKEIESQLSAYLDDEVGGSEKQAIKSHLEECKDCSELVRELEETKRLLVEFAEEPVPQEVVEKVKAGIREAERAKRAAPSKDIKESFLSRKALGYIIALASVLAVVIVVLIPLRGFFSVPMEPTMKLAPVSPSKEGESSQEQKGAAPQAEERQMGRAAAPEADSMVAEDMVRASDTNYDKGKVNELLDSYEDKEKQKTEAEVFSVEQRDEKISSMLAIAKALELDANHLEQCFEVLKSQNENILPIYAEKTKFETRDAWIIVLKDFSSATKGSQMKAYVLTTPACEIVLEVD